MKKATLQAAGTAVLGVALAAAAVTPAFADGLQGGITDGPTTGLPLQGLAGGPVTDSTKMLTSQTGSVHTITGTAQGLVNAAAPSVQSAAQAVPGLRSPAAAGPRALPVGLPAVSGLPGAGPATGALQGGLGQATQSLPVGSPLG